MSLSWEMSIFQAHKDGWRKWALEEIGNLSSCVSSHLTFLGPSFLFYEMD